jgi:hypothetical protein
MLSFPFWVGNDQQAWETTGIDLRILGTTKTQVAIQAPPLVRWDGNDATPHGRGSLSACE